MLQGWFDTTEMYYGTYSCSSISVNGLHYYNMPKAYFLVIFILFMVYLVVILRRCGNGTGLEGSRVVCVC